jgi:hypothetical protein
VGLLVKGGMGFVSWMGRDCELRDCKMSRAICELNKGGIVNG